MADEQQHEKVAMTMGRNLHKLLSVGQLIFEIDFRSDGPPCSCCCCYSFMLLLSCNCHCVCATTDESQQHYTVRTIIKRVIITKILNNLCRLICMMLFLLCNFLVGLS